MWILSSANPAIASSRKENFTQVLNASFSRQVAVSAPRRSCRGATPSACPVLVGSRVDSTSIASIQVKQIVLARRVRVARLVASFQAPVTFLDLVGGE